MWGWSSHQSTRAEAAAWTSWRRPEPRPTITDPEPWAESPEQGESAPAGSGAREAAGHGDADRNSGIAETPGTAAIAGTEPDDAELPEYVRAELAELMAGVLTGMCPPKPVGAGV